MARNVQKVVMGPSVNMNASVITMPLAIHSSATVHVLRAGEMKTVILLARKVILEITAWKDVLRMKVIIFIIMKLTIDLFPVPSLY